MIVSNINFPELPALRNHLAILIGIVAVSLVVQAGDQLFVSPNYDSLISEDIYADGNNWRQPEDNGREWRQPQREKESRIKFGYDPVYEEMRAKKSEEYSSKNFDYKATKPSALFRVDF